MDGKDYNRSTEAYDGSYTKTYERDDFVHDLILPFIKHGKSLLDIGCGDSRFLYYLQRRHPGLHLCGLERSRELIDKARKSDELKDIEIVEGDAMGFSLGRTFDIAVMSGVLSIFDDIEKPIRVMVDHLCPGGIGVIFGCFCAKDIDVRVRYRNNFAGSNEWESGLNMYSIDTMKSILSEYADDIEVFHFDLSIDLDEQDDPVRTHTIKTEDGGRLIVNGMNIINDFYAFRFKKKPRKKD